MSYIGQAALKNSELKRFDVTSSTSATHTLSWTAANEQSLFITINGVKQQDDAYTIAGSPTVITLSSALVAADKMEVIGILDIGEITVVGDNTISTAKIADGAINIAKLAASGTASATTFLRGDNSWQTISSDPTMGGDLSGTASNAQIVDDAVTAAKLANSINTEIAANTAKVTNATHTGDVTGATALTIAADAVDIAMLSATGTASADTFLRGDNAWAAAGSPAASCAFRVAKSSTQSCSQNADTEITWETSVFDVGSDFSLANNRFDCPNAGTYWFHFQVSTSFTFQNIEELCYIKKTDSTGGNAVTMTYRSDEPINDSNARGRAQGIYMEVSGMVVCAVGDRLTCRFRSEGDGKTINSAAQQVFFEGFQLI